MSLKTKVKNGIGIFLVVLSVCCGSPLFAGLQPEEGMDLSKPRIWTAVTGHQLKAAYEGRDGNKIRLLANGGKIKTILLEKLSAADLPADTAGFGDRPSSAAVVPRPHPGHEVSQHY